MQGAICHFRHQADGFDGHSAILCPYRNVMLLTPDFVGQRQAQAIIRYAIGPILVARVAAPFPFMLPAIQNHRRRSASPSRPFGEVAWRNYCLGLCRHGRRRCPHRIGEQLLIGIASLIGFPDRQGLLPGLFGWRIALRMFGTLREVQPVIIAQDCTDSRALLGRDIFGPPSFHKLIHSLSRILSTSQARLTK